MENKRNPASDELEKKTQLFNKSVELCSLVFDRLAYRRWHNGTKDKPDGFIEPAVNEGIYDIQMYGFMEYEKRQIINKAQFIKDAFLVLCCNDTFIDTIEKGTYDTNKVKLRTELWFAKLREIVGLPDHDRRLYTFEEKKLLFEEADGICQICHNKINGIDNADVDHIARFSEGGSTTISNAQITHRYCNLAKG